MTDSEEAAEQEFAELAKHVGLFILWWGAVEQHTWHMVTALSENEAVGRYAARIDYGKRIELISLLLSERTIPPDQMAEWVAVTKKLDAMARVRNELAHNEASVEILTNDAGDMRTRFGVGRRRLEADGKPRALIPPDDIAKARIEIRDALNRLYSIAGKLSAAPIRTDIRARVAKAQNIVRYLADTLQQ